MDYRAFVREKMAEMREKPISQQEKMKEIGRMWRGRKPSKGKQHTKGKGMNLTGGGDVIELDNGVLLHPDMIGEGFWSDMWDGVSKGVNSVAKVVTSPVGKAVMAVAPLIL